MVAVPFVVPFADVDVPLDFPRCEDVVVVVFPLLVVVFPFVFGAIAVETDRIDERMEECAILSPRLGPRRRSLVVVGATDRVAARAMR